MKNKTIRRISLFLNLVLITALIVLSSYILDITKQLKELEYRTQFFIAEMISRDLYMGNKDIDPKQVANGLKMPVVATSTPKVSVTTSSNNNVDFIKAKIKEYFPKSYVTMTAIAMAESHLNNDVMNWNCYYNKDKSIVYTTRVKGSHSTSCKKEHRIYSWSIDCFVLMKNYVGLKECPDDVTLDQHLAEMAELSKQRGYQPWSSFNAGKHEQYLTQK